MPRCFLDEVGNRLRGHGQSRPNEMVAEKVEAAIDPVDECCGAYVGSWPISAAPVGCLRVRYWAQSSRSLGRVGRQLMTLSDTSRSSVDALRKVRLIT